jgi:hypothetical protein
MLINRIFSFIEYLVLTTMFTCLQCEQPLSDQLIHILASLQPFRSQLCQFKFENCIQDSSYADQFDTDCNMYSRLRDCFRLLLDESQCLSIQLKHQYQQAKQNEYDACQTPSLHQSVRSSMFTSLSTRLNVPVRTNSLLVIMTISLSSM